MQQRLVLRLDGLPVLHRATRQAALSLCSIGCCTPLEGSLDVSSQLLSLRALEHATLGHLCVLLLGHLSVQLLGHLCMCYSKGT